MLLLLHAGQVQVGSLSFESVDKILKCDHSNNVFLLLLGGGWGWVLINFLGFRGGQINRIDGLKE